MKLKVLMILVAIALLCSVALFALTTLAPLAKPIRPELIYEQTMLQQQERILALQACSEAGIVHTECAVDWQHGTVSSKKK